MKNDEFVLDGGCFTLELGDEKFPAIITLVTKTGGTFTSRFRLFRENQAAAATDIDYLDGFAGFRDSTRFIEQRERNLALMGKAKQLPDFWAWVHETFKERRAALNRDIIDRTKHYITLDKILGGLHPHLQKQ